jgi:hypothetical protein
MMMHVAVAVLSEPVTTSLRRLVGRFGVVVCEPVGRHSPVSDGVGQRLPVIGEIMTAWDRLTEADKRACPDAVNAITSRHRVGGTFDASIVELTASVGLVQVSVSTAWRRWSGGLDGRREHGQVQGDRCCRPESPVPDGRG